MQPGAAIDRFEVQEELGSGGMATVYRVQHRRLGGVFALKLLRLGHPRLVARLVQEGRIQARLEHPHIVRVLDVVEHPGGIGLLMEFVEGTSLERSLAQGPMEVDEALLLFRQVLQAVEAAHQAGVAHRDIKPANILLTVQGERVIAKVTDFGIAKLFNEESADGQATRGGVPMGTPGYMAPEQIRSAAEVDHRADIFSLGAVLYEMLCGQPAFGAVEPYEAMSRTLSGSHLPLCERRPDLPPALCGVVERALRVRPEERFADCAELEAALFGGARTPVDLPPLVQRPADRRTSGATLAPLAETWREPTFPSFPEPERVEDPPTGDSLVERPTPAPAEPPVDRLRGWVRGETGEKAMPIPAAQRATRPFETPRPPGAEDDSTLNARDGAGMMGELLGAILHAAAWGAVRSARILAAPVILLLVLGWLVAGQARDRLVELDAAHHAQTLALNRAMEEGLNQVPALVAAGANAELLGRLQRKVEEAPDPAARAAATRELSSAMSQQVGLLPPAQGPEAQAARRELEAALARLEREALRMDELERQRAAARQGLGAKLARALR